ncbi:MAG: twin-arginine translocase subunit TatC [Flammeovirgaceae bacterium]
MEDFEVGNDSVSRGGGGSKPVPVANEVPQTEQPTQVDESAEGGEMTFLDHLEELRWHILRAVASVFVFAIIAFLSVEFVFDVLLLGPSKLTFPTYQFLCYLSGLMDSPLLCIEKLPFIIQNRTMMGQFSVHVTSSLAIGLVCAFPYAFWEIWRFVKPGLYPTEQKVSRGATLIVALLFFSGVLFGYYIITPLSINFLSNYQISPDILNEIDLTSYINTVVMLTLVSGIMFQLPIIVYFLSKVGIVTPALMRKYRRHSIVTIIALSAIITPPDIFSQLLIALPISVLYEISIGVSARVERNRERDALELSKTHES